MTIETLAKQGRSTIPTTLAGIDSQRLKKMRDAGLRNCFTHFNEMRYHTEYVVRLLDKTFVNDAASCNVNATWFAMENTKGSLIWIANGGSDDTDYSALRGVALRKVRNLYCIGGNSGNLRRTFEGIIPNIIDVADMHEAVTKAFYSNIENTTILYSPASDNGNPIEYNGELFRHEVNDL